MYNYFMRIGLVLNILDDKYQLYLYSGIVRKAEELGIEIVCFQQENTHFSSDELIVVPTNGISRSVKEEHP